MPGHRPQQALTPELIDALAEATRTGLKGKFVADIAGVTQRTLNRWKQAGTEELDRLENNPEAEPNPDLTGVVQLVQRIKADRARFVQENLLLIRRAATEGRQVKTVTRTDKNGRTVTERTETIGGLWTAAAWLLERGETAEFGRQIRQLEVTGADGGPVQVDALTEAALEEKLGAYYQGVADGQQLADQPADGASGNGTGA